jgi:gliding motility-associated-like protein
MKRIFSLFSLTGFVLIMNGLTPVFGQPGCPAVNAGPDVTVGCGNNCTTLTATVVPTGATNSYAVTSIPYAPPYPYNTGTPILVNIDDTWSSAIALPFNFCFYGNSYSQIVAGSNGLITFDVSVAGGFCDWSYTDACPNANLPLNSIFGPYHDIDPSVSGTMYYAILGNYPCRTFVVNWNQIAMFSCTNLIATHQIVLYESTNIIEVYIQNKPLCSSWNSGNAVVGIQNATGTIGIAAPGRNTSAWTASNEAWRFYPNGSSSVAVTWFDGATQIGTGTSIQVCPNATTTYTAQAVYNTCSGTNVTVTDDVTVNYNANFSINVTPTSATICPGDNVAITASGPANVTYTWTPAAGLNTTTGQNVIASPTTTTTYTVTGVDATNCSLSVPITITVSGNPTVTVTPQNSTICSGSSVVLTASGATNYTWSPGTGLSATSGATVTASPTSPTTYTVTGSNGGCSGTATAQVNIAPNLVISVSPPSASICLGTSVDLTASGADTYVWTPATGLSSTTDTTVTASPTTTTTYIVTGTTNGCTGQTSVMVDLNGSLNISVTPPNPGICLGGSIDLTASGGLNYTWSPPNNLSSTTGTTVTASPPITTTYTVMGVDANQCAGTTLVTVTLIPAPDLVFYPADPVICKGESIDIEVSGGTSYTWSPSTGLSATTGSLITAAPSATTTYTVLGSNFGCTGTSSIEVVVSPIPEVEFSASTYAGCEDLLVTFYDQSTPPGAVWHWDFGDGSMPNAFTAVPNPSHLYTEPGQYDITLLVTSADGCQAQMSVPQMITVYKNPIASFYPNPQQTWIYEPTINFFDESINANTWSWDFGETYVLDNYSNDQFPSHTYSDTGLYTITLAVMSSNGCVDTIQKTIYIEPNIAFYIPNSFTPNNDGKNDKFIVQGDGIDENTFIMRIYDRWGKQVYFSADLTAGWDGKLNGSDKRSPEGVFCYIISLKDVKGKYHEYKGMINLIR